MTSSRVTCPECGTVNTKYGGTHSRRNDEQNYTCSDCGEPLPCPVCQAGQYPDMDAEADTCGPGYFRGESTGDCLPCHFCNHEEIVRRRRQGQRV